MALYRAALTTLYPRHQVRAILLWTDGPFTMELGARQMDQALAQIAR
jgi:ATP-dependent helicase/nuclease subunit A